MLFRSLHDEGPGGAAGDGPFSTYIGQTTKVQELGGTSQANGGIFVDLKEAMSDIVSDTDATGRRYQLNGWALDSVVEPLLWGSVDTTGRPIWTDLPVDKNAPAISSAGRRPSTDSSPFHPTRANAGADQGRRAAGYGVRRPG